MGTTKLSLDEMDAILSSATTTAPTPATEDGNTVIVLANTLFKVIMGKVALMKADEQTQPIIANALKATMAEGVDTTVTVKFKGEDAETTVGINDVKHIVSAMVSIIAHYPKRENITHVLLRAGAPTSSAKNPGKSYQPIASPTYWISNPDVVAPLELFDPKPFFQALIDDAHPALVEKLSGYKGGYWKLFVLGETAGLVWTPDKPNKADALAAELAASGLTPAQILEKAVAAMAEPAKVSKNRTNPRRGTPKKQWFNFG